MQLDQLPIVYSKLYNIGFCGIENFHPFDSKKFSKIVANLTDRGLLRLGQVWAAVWACDAGRHAMQPATSWFHPAPAAYRARRNLRASIA